MLLQSLSSTQARLALGALRATAQCATGEHPAELSFLLASARVWGVDPDEAAQIAPASVEEIQRAFVTPTDRERLVQSMILMALMDGRVELAESALITRFAGALEVHDSRVKSLSDLAHRRIVRMFLGIAWNSYGHQELRAALNEQGLSGVWKIVGPMLGSATDYALAQRFIACGGYPPDSLGRAYFEFLQGHGFPFPGEPGGVPERGVWHDLTHVLAGYETDPAGEVQNVSFIAGYRREDPFFWLYTIALQFHFGIKVSPYSPANLTGFFTPDRVTNAYQRGLKVRIDLSDRWDYTALLSQPLNEVRASLGIDPQASEPSPTTGEILNAR